MEEIRKEKNVVAKKKKKNWGALILIVTIVVMVLIVGLMCSGLLVKEKDNNKKTTVDDGGEVLDETANWGDYLLKNSVTGVAIERSKEVSLIDPSQEYHNTVNLTEEQAKELINNIKKYSVSKVNVETPDYTYGDTLTIMYVKDSNSYELKIKNGDFQFSSDQPKDKDLIKVLEENLVESEEADNGTTTLYRIVGYDELIFNEYFDQ